MYSNVEIFLIFETLSKHIHILFFAKTKASYVLQNVVVTSAEPATARLDIVLFFF